MRKKEKIINKIKNQQESEKIDSNFCESENENLGDYLLEKEFKMNNVAEEILKKQKSDSITKQKKK